MGDCTLNEVKHEYGKCMALMGNLHATEVILRGIRNKVLEASRKAIEDAGDNRCLILLILSTGNQCGFDAPDENLFTVVEAAERYGR